MVTVMGGILIEWSHHSVETQEACGLNGSTLEETGGNGNVGKDGDGGRYSTPPQAKSSLDFRNGACLPCLMHSAVFPVS